VLGAARRHEPAGRCVAPRDAVPVLLAWGPDAARRSHAVVRRSGAMAAVRPAQVAAVARSQHEAAHSLARHVADPHARRAAAVWRLAAAWGAARGCVAPVSFGRSAYWARHARLRAKAGSGASDAARDWRSRLVHGRRSDDRRVAARSLPPRARRSAPRRAVVLAAPRWSWRWAMPGASRYAALRRCAAHGSRSAQQRC